MKGWTYAAWRLGGTVSTMADSLDFILHVFPAPGDDAGELAEWLRGELPDLNVQEADRLPGEVVLTGATGPVDIAGPILVQLDPMALHVVLATVTDWAARNDRMVEIGAGGHLLKLGRVTRQASQPGKELVPLSPRESLRVVRWSLRGRGDVPGRRWLEDASLLVRGSIDIEAVPTREFRRAAAFAGILTLVTSGFFVLFSIAILAISRNYHGLSISTRYPVHRIYEGLVQYIIHITPPPGSAHIILVYSVYLAVIPVLFAGVFMYLKVGSTRLVAAVITCAVFMVAPFIIAVTSIRVGSTNCGSWNYPEPNSGTECYSVLSGTFRIAFAVGIIGLFVPVIYLIRGRQHKGGLLRALITCASVAMVVLRFISALARGQARRSRDVTADQESVSGVDK
jgi:hypothetical protein